LTNGGRREGKELFSLPEIQAFNKYFPLKVIGCHLEQSNGEPLTDPQKITYDALDDVDARVFGFAARSLFAAYSEQQRLGNASARLSSNGSGLTRIAAPTNRTN
jgi:hypothetical protein